jgi:hypothetical protein
MDDGHASGTSVMENICDPKQKSVFTVSRVDGNDAGLTIHAQDGRVRRIDGDCIRHIKLLPGGERRRSRL